MGAFVALFMFADDLAERATWFADGWSAQARALARLVAGIGIVTVGLFLGILSYSAVTLLIGEPFYEKISEWVEERFGGVPGEVRLPWWRSFRRGVVDSARLLLAVTTTAGNLPARWVVHTVGPVWTAHEDRSLLLRSCYENSLRVGDELGARSTAFPLCASHDGRGGDAAPELSALSRCAGPATGRRRR